MVTYEDFEVVITILLFGFLGIVVSMIFWTLNNSGILIDEFVSGSITITDLQAGIIVFFLVIGIVVVALKRT